MNNKGFTLIELLVVISIIGLLSGVVLVSLEDAKIKGRDTKRIQDLSAIRTALEMYKSDHGHYPKAGNCNMNTNCYAYSSNSTWTVLQTALQKYISELPKDPINIGGGPWGNNNFIYAYGNVYDGNLPGYKENYDLTAQFENDEHPLRCEIKKYHFHHSNAPWCGSYSKQIYEASIL